MRDRPTVVFDASPQTPPKYLNHEAIVVVAVADLTTLLVTASQVGITSFVARDAADGEAIAGQLDDPLQVDGHQHAVGARELFLKGPTDRPLVLVTAPAGRLAAGAWGAAPHLACIRNTTATVAAVRRASSVSILARGRSGQTRCEDMLVAARLCRDLVAHGFSPYDHRTADLIKRWADANLNLLRLGQTAEKYLRSGLKDELEFMLTRVDDVDTAVRCEAGVVRPTTTGSRPIRLRRDVPVTARFGHARVAGGR